MANKSCQIGLPTAALLQKEVLKKIYQRLTPNNYSAVVWTGRCTLQIIYFFPPPYRTCWIEKVSYRIPSQPQWENEPCGRCSASRRSDCGQAVTAQQWEQYPLQAGAYSLSRSFLCFTGTLQFNHGYRTWSYLQDVYRLWQAGSQTRWSE